MSRRQFALCLVLATLTAMCLTTVTAGRAGAQATGPGVVVDQREEETPRVLCFDLSIQEGVLDWLSYQRARPLAAGTTEGLQLFRVYRYGRQYDVTSARAR